MIREFYFPDRTAFETDEINPSLTRLKLMRLALTETVADAGW